MAYIATHRDNCNIQFVAHDNDAWMADCSLLTPEEEGIYSRTFRLMVKVRGPIGIQQLVQISPGIQRKSLERILESLQALGLIARDGDLITHPRCAKVLQKARNNAELSRKNGKMGGRPSNKNNGLEKPPGFLRARDEYEDKEDTVEASASTGSGKPPPQPPPDPFKEAFDEAVPLIGSRNRAVVADMLKKHGLEAVRHAIAQTRAERPRGSWCSYFIGCCRGYGNPVPKPARRPASPLDNLITGGLYAVYDQLSPAEREAFSDPRAGDGAAVALLGAG